MKINKIILTLVFTVIGLLFWNMRASAVDPNYCHDESEGKFTFGVEQAIHIEASGDIDMGAICPGCRKDWECGHEGAPHIHFDATGSLHCPFRMTFDDVNDWTNPHVILEFFWYYWDGIRWRTWNNTGQTISFLDINNDGIGDYSWGAFICHWITDCEAPAGTYTKEVTVYVDYVCQ